MLEPAPESARNASAVADLLAWSPPAADEPGIALETLKKSLQALDSELEAHFRDGVDILALVTARAWGVEQLLLYAWHQTLPQDSGLGLVAVGGFGRGELHPHSDVDLLILFAEDFLDKQCETAVEQFIMLLWDAGFYLGHSVRNLKQCEEEVAADVSTATSLMECRLLAGPEDIYQQMVANNEPDQVWSAREFFNAKFTEQQERHAQFGDTAYNLEPNIKEGSGGLRDIQNIGWVAKRHFGANNLHGLVDHGFLTESEFNKLIEGQHFLWRVRFAIHILAGRAEDRLLFDYQRKTAELFGYELAENSNEAVEQFMQSYYRQVTTLERLNERLLALFREELLADELPRPVDINDDFHLLHGSLDVKDPELFVRRPEALMEIFLMAAQRDEILGFRASAIRLIVDHCYLIDEDFRNNEKVLSCFCELLCQPKGVYTQLKRMNRYGVLAAFMPAFGKIVGRMQFDLFHVYTVDQHTLFVLRNLRRVSYGKYQETFPNASKIFKQIHRPLVLYLAALFHDIAKGRNGDHSVLGADDAREFCARLPMEEEDRELVAWLVRHHLLMSQTAQKKDISDPDTVMEFARIVGDHSHLDYLYLLTVADVSATSPRLWTSWKSGLLWELHQVTQSALMRDTSLPVNREQHMEAVRNKVLQKLLDKGYDRKDVEHSWEALPDSAFLRFSASQLEWSTREVIASDDETLVAVRLKPSRGISEVLVCSPDYTGLFATVTAILGELGLSVLTARIVTGSDHRSYDLFQVMDRHQQPLNDADTARLIKLLLRSLKEKDVLEPLRRPLPRRLRPFQSKPQLRFSTARAGMVTELEVRCTDRPGLLSQLAAAMVDSDVRIHDAMIATFGETIEDIFHLTDRQDQPLDDFYKNELTRAIYERLDL